jgi:hypothetical protein
MNIFFNQSALHYVLTGSVSLGFWGLFPTIPSTPKWGGTRWGTPHPLAMHPQVVCPQY